MRKIFALLWLALGLSFASAQAIDPVGGSSSLVPGTTPTGCTALSLFYADASSNFGCMAGTSWDNTNRSLTISGGTLTGSSAPFLTLSQTWNNAATVFSALDVNITDTASNASSSLITLTVGGSQRYTLSKGGSAIYNGSVTSNNGSIRVGSNTGLFQIGASFDVSLGRNAAASLRLGAADAAAPVAQTFGVQSVVAGTSNTAGVLWTQKGSAGTGTGVGGNIKWQVALAGSTGTTQNSFTDALTLDASAAVPRITAGGPIKRAGYAIASLPTGSIGDTAYVTDQLTACPALGGTFTNGGSVVCAAFYNGTAWVHE